MMMPLLPSVYPTPPCAASSMSRISTTPLQSLADDNGRSLSPKPFGGDQHIPHAAARLTSASAMLPTASTPGSKEDFEFVSPACHQQSAISTSCADVIDLAGLRTR